MSTDLFKTLVETNSVPLKKYHYGKFVVIAEQSEVEDEPKNIRILGPGHMRLSVAGANALAEACRIAEFMHNNPITD